MMLRCQGNKLHGIVVSSESSGEIEFRCESRFCGKAAGVVVLHRFDLSTGSHSTVKYSEPPTPRKGESYASGS